MRLFFILLSLGYISAIFFLADSPVVSSLASFNPYSLLHIPVYGVLAFLLVFSISPVKINLARQNRRRNHFLVAGLIALGVAIADEFHQSFIPSRTASISDIVLDLIGIILALLLIAPICRKGIFHLAKRLNRDRF